MKRLLMFVAFVLCGALLRAADVQSLTLRIGEVRDIRVEFPVDSYALSPASDAPVSVRESNSVFYVSAQKAGKCDLFVEGTMGGSKHFRITVLSMIHNRLIELRNALDALPLEEIEIRNNRLEVRGRLTHRDEWERLERTLADFAESDNLAEYCPTGKKLHFFYDRGVFVAKGEVSDPDDWESAAHFLKRSENHENRVVFKPVGKGFSCSLYDGVMIAKGQAKTAEDWDYLIGFLKLNAPYDNRVTFRSADMPVTYSYRNGTVIATGEADTLELWRKLKNFLHRYEKSDNRVRFRVTDETLGNLRALLRSAGFSIAEAGANPQPGQLALKVDNDTILVSGTLHSKDDLEKAKNVLNGSPIVREKLARMEFGATQIPVRLTVNVAVLTVASSDTYDRSGNVNPVAQIFGGDEYGWSHGSGGLASTAHAFSKVSFKGIISFIDGEQVARNKRIGEVSFLNGGKGKFKDGGAIKQPVSGIESGGIEDIQYGLDLDIGGEMESDTVVSLTKFTATYRTVSTDAKENYNQKTIEFTDPIPHLTLGCTYFVAQSHDEGDRASDSGFPILRHIPLINLFFSDSSSGTEATDVLLLVSVEAAQTTVDGIPLKMDGKGTLERSKKSAKQLLRE